MLERKTLDIIFTYFGWRGPGTWAGINRPVQVCRLGVSCKIGL